MSGAIGEETEAQRMEREAKQKEEADDAARNQFPPPPPMTQQNFIQYMQMVEERQRITLEQQNKFFQELLQQNRASETPSLYLSHTRPSQWTRKIGLWILSESSILLDVTIKRRSVTLPICCVDLPHHGGTIL